MRLASDIHPANPAFGSTGSSVTNLSTSPTDSAESRYSDYKIIRRNGAIAPFQPDKIAIALTKAFIAVNGGTEAERNPVVVRDDIESVQRLTTGCGRRTQTHPALYR